MSVLAGRGLVDRGPEFEGDSYRIWLTKQGENVLARASRAVESALATDDALLAERHQVAPAERSLKDER
jgi:hypothetical protein